MSEQPEMDSFLLVEEDNESTGRDGYIFLDVTAELAHDDGVPYQYDINEDQETTTTIVEYIEEEIDAEETQETNGTNSHTLTLRLLDNGSGEVYHCLECAVDFATIEEFTQIHHQIETNGAKQEESEEGIILEEPQWEIIEEVEADSPKANIEVPTIKKEICSIEEESLENLEEHLQTDDEAINYAQLREVLIKQESDATDVEENSEIYFCYKCQNVFDGLESAEQHDCSTSAVSLENNENFTNENQESKSKFHCAICTKVFDTINALNSHNRMHKAKGVKQLQELTMAPPAQTTCQICNTTFGSEKNLKFHMRMHTKRKGIKSIEDVLPAAAKKQYNELNKFFCEICNKSFDQNLLTIHKNMHQNIEEHTCSICNRQFENLPSYEVHMQMHTDNPKKPRPSAASTATTSSGTVSTGTVGGKLKFPCQYCGREFSRPFEKVKHERVHTGEKPYGCEVCGKTFRVSYSLTLHLRSHTDIRPYVCSTCNKRFKSQPVYAHHLRSHQPERNYKCEICSKTFRTSVQLCTHRNGHTKPYNCPECNRPFASLYAVKIHMKTHNKSNKSYDNLKHRCEICGAVYARIFALRYHMKDQHSLEMDTAQIMVMQKIYVKNENIADVGDEAVVDQVVDDDDNDGVGIDSDAAALIAAAADADCATYIEANAMGDDGERDETHIAAQQLLQIEGHHSFGHEDEQMISQNEEIIVDNYHTEEIITDWLAK